MIIRNTKHVYNSTHKRTNGQYFTAYNPFDNACFLQWANDCNLKNATILEPFAGSNNLIEMLKKMGLCNNFKSFDIEPQNINVEKHDTLADFPRNFPWREHIRAS